MLAMAVSCDAALFGLLKSKRSSRSGPVVKQSLMIFPFDKDTESAAGVSDDFGRGIADYLRTTMGVSKGYSVFLFDSRLTPVRRAKEDNVIKDQDINGPFFTEKAKTVKLADLLAADCYIVGSVESYSYDKEKKSAEITLKADIVNAKSGKVTQEFMVGGAAAQAAQPMDEEELQSIAAGKAVEALTQKIMEATPADAKAPAKSAAKAKGK
jgi:hypothetical protein